AIEGPRPPRRDLRSSLGHNRSATAVASMASHKTRLQRHKRFWIRFGSSYPCRAIDFVAGHVHWPPPSTAQRLAAAT
ncbi:hypothetical protein CRG98_049574, partial [Punica granatum]